MRLQCAATSRRVARIAVAGSAALAVVAVFAPAGAVINDKVKKACKSDYHRLCPGYKIGSAQLRACMESKQADITWSCVQALIDSGEVDKQRVGKK